MLEMAGDVAVSEVMTGARRRPFRGSAPSDQLIRRDRDTDLPL